MSKDYDREYFRELFKDSPFRVDDFDGERVMFNYMFGTDESEYEKSEKELFEFFNRPSKEDVEQITATLNRCLCKLVVINSYGRAANIPNISQSSHDAIDFLKEAIERLGK